jgi:hypothetical protein
MNRVFLILAIPLLFLSCKKSAIPVESFEFAPERIEFDYLKVKSKLEYTDAQQKNRATLHIRVKSDSIIWISIQHTIEAFRIKIERDSLHVIDRLKKVYHAYSYSDLQKKLGFESLSFF